MRRHLGQRSKGRVQRVAHVVAFASALLGTSVAATAQERVVMPYACAVEAGRIILKPSAERGYAIIGKHEQQPFTACSPADERRCRTWMLHKFDLDCSGARVAWLSVVGAAIATRTRRAWVDDERLYLRFWFERRDPNGRPCFARPWHSPEAWPGQGPFLYNRACGPFRPREAAAVVSMPRGFAPVMGLGARFVGEPLRTTAGSAEPAARSIATGASNKSLADVKALPPSRVAAAEPGAKVHVSIAEHSTASANSRSDGEVPVADAVVPRSPPVRLAEQVSRSSEQRLPEWSATTHPTVVPQEPHADYDPWGAFLRAMQEPDLPLALGLIGALALTLTTFAWMRSRYDTRGSAAVATRGQIGAAGSAPALGPPLSPGPGEQEAGEELLHTAETFFAHVAHIAERMRARDALRDVVSDELRSIESILRSAELTRACATKDWSYVRACAVQILTDLERVRRVAQSANEAAAAPVPGSFGSEMPSDRGEALAVLGVNADASEKVVKKIVDAMRQTWHPDLARDEDDRRAREARIKQINSAWDLLRSRPREA